MPPPRSPADEYERRLDERRADAVDSVKAFVAWWAALHPLAVITLCGGITNLGPRGAAQLIGLGIAWVLFSLPAVGSAATALGNWPVLPFRWVAAGLVPWFVMLAELTPVAYYAARRFL